MLRLLTWSILEGHMNEHQTTLKVLLRLGLSQEYTWISEPPELEITVNWVVAHIDPVEKGDVLLLTRSDIPSVDWEDIHSREVAAVILVGSKLSDIEAVPPGLAVLAAPEPVTLRQVQRDLLNILTNERVIFLEKGVRIHAQLTKLAAEGQGIGGLAQAISTLSGRGVLIPDNRLGILADHPCSTLLGIWEDVLELLTDKKQLPPTLADRKTAGKEKPILQQELQGGLVRLVTPISVGGVARGYLSLVDISQPLDSLDRLVAEQGSLVCAIDMARVKAVREAEKRLKGDLLTALLQENITPRDAILWVQSMGMDLDLAHTALRFAWDAPVPPSMRRLETLVNGEVARRGAKVLVESLGSEIACICQVKRTPGRPEEALELAHAVAEVAKQEYPQVPMRCGIGRPALEVPLWRDSFRQAGQALEMARRLNLAKPSYFPDLSVYRLLFQLENHPDLHTFKEEILGSLLAYEGSGDLVKTLEVFFEHNGNLSQAAEALYIHRNTLIYRMERIEEITGLDLNDTETRLAVQLALRVHRMRVGKNVQF